MAGQAAEDHSGAQARAAGVVVVEQPAYHFARRIQPRYRLQAGVQHPPGGVDAHPAKGERYAAGYGVAQVGRRVDGLRPVGLGRRYPLRSPPVFHRRVVGNVGLHRRVVFGDGGRQPRRVDVQPLRQLFDAVGLRHGHLRNVILVAQQVFHLVVEDLKGDALRLRQQGAPVGYIGIVAEVGALVQKPLPVQVDHYAEGVGMFLVEFGDGAVAVGRGVQVPGDGVAAAPVAVGHGAGFQGHADAVAGVVGDAAHFDQFPARPQVAAAHFGVGLEAAGGQHHRPGLDFRGAVRPLRPQPVDLPGGVPQQRGGLGGVADVDALGGADVELLVGKALAGAYRLHEQPAPEAELAGGIVLERLPPVGEDEADAFGAHPLHRRQRLADQDLRQIGVAEALGDPHHIVVELVFGVAADVHLRLFGGRHIGDDRLDVFQVVESEADDAAGEVGIAAAEVFGGFLHHQDGIRGFPGGYGRRKGGVARPHHHNVILPVSH